MRQLSKHRVIILTCAFLAVCIAIAGILLVPRLLKPAYLIRFDSAGGTRVQNQTVREGGSVAEVSEPEKYGFTFLGWQLDGEPYDFTAAVTGDMILKAVWEATGETRICTVGFFSDGGSAVDPIEVSEGGSAMEPTAPTKDGFIFTGWFLFGGDPFDFGAPVTESVVLIAHWAGAGSDIEPTSSASTVSPDTASATAVPPQGGTTTPGSTPTPVTEDWESLMGYWYLEGRDDIYFKAYDLPTIPGYGPAIGYDFSGVDDRYGIIYDGWMTGFCDKDYGYQNLLDYLKITHCGSYLIINLAGKDYTFYRQVNYPSHITFYVTSITLDTTSITLNANSSCTITATVSPDYADNLFVIWSSSDPNIAFIDNREEIGITSCSAHIYFSAAGVFTITATSYDGAASASCVVTVTPAS